MLTQLIQQISLYHIMIVTAHAPPSRLHNLTSVRLCVKSKAFSLPPKSGWGRASRDFWMNTTEFSEEEIQRSQKYNAYSAAKLENSIWHIEYARGAHWILEFWKLSGQCQNLNTLHAYSMPMGQMTTSPLHGRSSRPKDVCRNCKAEGVLQPKSVSFGRKNSPSYQARKRTPRTTCQQ